MKGGGNKRGDKGFELSQALRNDSRRLRIDNNSRGRPLHNRPEPVELFPLGPPSRLGLRNERREKHGDALGGGETRGSLTTSQDSLFRTIKALVALVALVALAASAASLPLSYPMI
jgi:hypothetical protein